jgi:hypothetical protein
MTLETSDTGRRATAALAGSARRDITPAWPVLQAGFGQRQAPSTGVLDRIFTKALYLAAGSERFVLVTADLICIPKPLAEAVTQRIVARTGLTEAQVCLCASHTHSGPVPWDPAGTAPGIADWVPLLVEAMVEVACEALERGVPSRIRTAVGRLDLLLNRRTRGRPNLVDPRVPVIAVEDAGSGHLAAVLFGAGCHPVTLGWDSYAISGDFPGRAQALIETELGVANALFFNSTEGNVIPATSPNCDALDPRGYCGGSSTATDHMAAALAAAVCTAVRENGTATTAEIGASRQVLTLRPAGTELDPAAATARLTAARTVLGQALGADFETRVPASALWAAASQHVIRHDLAEPAMRSLMIACCHYLGLVARQGSTTAPRPVEVPIQLLRINDFALLALPGEVLVEVGLAWQRASGTQNAFVIGLANAHYRYLPLASHFGEPDAHQHYETVTAGLEPAAMNKAIDAGREMLGALTAAAPYS